jgi:hypothetical protein
MANMDQYWRGWNTKTLWVLVLLGIAYISLVYYRPTLTGENNVDAIIGVMLGLYICSHPAAHFVDLLFWGRGGRRQSPSKQSIILWFTLNVIVLLIGWLVIFVGTTRLIGRAD